MVFAAQWAKSRSLTQYTGLRATILCHSPSLFNESVSSELNQDTAKDSHPTIQDCGRLNTDTPGLFLGKKLALLYL